MSDEPQRLDEDAQRMRAYLLGELTPEERVALEARFFERDEEFDRLLEAQYDLIDASVRGTLTPAEREAVLERVFSHPDSDHRLLLARALSQRSLALGGHVTPHSPPASSWLPTWLAVAAALVVMFAGASLWLTFDNARLKGELAIANTKPASAPPAASPAALLPPLIADVTLVPRVARSAESSRRVEVSPEAQIVRLQLALDETAPAFTVGVERTGSGRVSTQRLIAPQADGTLVVWIPADIVRAGNFEVLVWRGEENTANLVATYVFSAPPQ